MKQAFASQSSQNVAPSMRAPMSSFEMILAPIAAMAASSASLASLAGCTNGFEAGVATGTANATTRPSGLAFAPCAAKKHDRTYNWQQRPLSLRGGPG